MNPILQTDGKEKKVLYKLKIKNYSEEDTRSQLQLLSYMEPAFGFYDPNEAPLFSGQDEGKVYDKEHFQYLGGENLKITH